MGDHKGRGFKIVFQGLEKRGDTGFEIIETLSFGGGKGVYSFSPLQKELGAGFLDMIKGVSIPGSQVDFIEPFIDTDLFPGADELCCVPAPCQTAGINLVKPDLGKIVFPEQGLGHACFIQGNICLADETACLVALYLPVAQQENTRSGIGGSFERVGRGRL